MKHEWRKAEKNIYLPKQTPIRVDLKSMSYITLEGVGNPNSDRFAKTIEALYGVAYTIKMMPKKGIEIDGYFDYTVYPLEGHWDLDEEGRTLNYLDKDHFVYKLMIRQPEFVTASVFELAIELAKKKKNPLTDAIKFEVIEEGLCVQMLHLGSYDAEPQSFKLIETYCEENSLKRLSLTHKEIYLSDARKVAPEKLKTVLRIQVSESK
ncbi:MAG: GyrI-like domain-containing protein [Turicibacter sp.]